MSLLGRPKMLSPSDYTVFAIGEQRKSQLTCPADYMEIAHVTIEWE